jgi:hypothetical protein
VNSRASGQPLSTVISAAAQRGYAFSEGCFAQPAHLRAKAVNILILPFERKSPGATAPRQKTEQMRILEEGNDGPKLKTGGGGGIATLFMESPIGESHIFVSARDGIVTLIGQVGSDARDEGLAAVAGLRWTVEECFQSA